MSKGKLFVISGASGVGKSTVLGIVMKKNPDLRFSVSATTRAPRPGEQEGVSYYFVTNDQFEKMIAEDAFLEYDKHTANYYGTPAFQVEEKLQRGSVILDIEPAGAKIVREKRPDCVLIFIMPPSQEELERRLRGRGTEPEEVIRGRMKTSQYELSRAFRYQYIVLNDEVEKAVERITTIIDAEHMRYSRMENTILEVLKNVSTQ